MERLISSELNGFMPDVPLSTTSRTASMRPSWPALNRSCIHFPHGSASRHRIRFRDRRREPDHLGVVGDRQEVQRPNEADCQPGVRDDRGADEPRIEGEIGMEMYVAEEDPVCVFPACVGRVGLLPLLRLARLSSILDVGGRDFHLCRCGQRGAGACQRRDAPKHSEFLSHTESIHRVSSIAAESRRSAISRRDFEMHTSVCGSGGTLGGFFVKSYSR